MIYENIDRDWGKYLSCDQCQTSASDRATFTFQMCTHIIDYIDNGDDFEELDGANVYALRAAHGARVEVKELPFLGWTTIVTDIHIGDYLPYKLYHKRSTGAIVEADLGMLGPGEGRLVASRSIMDFILSQCHPEENWTGDLKTRCPSNYHRHTQQRSVDAQDYSNSSMKMMMLASIVLEGACIFCVMESHSEDMWGLGGEDLGKPDSKTTQLLGGLGGNG